MSLEKMSYEELDEKYMPYTVEGYTGIEFWLDEQYNNAITNLLDDIILIYPDFKIYQLKVKYDMIRFYTNLPHTLENIFEHYIEDEYREYKKRNAEQRIKQIYRDIDSKIPLRAE